MDHERIVRILLEISKKTPLLLGSLKYVILPHIQTTFDKKGIITSLDWVNISEYQLYKGFDDLMRKYPDKLDVFEKLFCG